MYSISNDSTLCTITADSLDSLEDALYIEHEMTPTSRNWREEMHTAGSTLFDYHGLDPVRVYSLNGDRYAFNWTV